MSPAFTIRPLRHASEAVPFLLAARAHMFSDLLDPAAVPPDLQDFAAHYVQTPGLLLGAHDHTGQLIATAGFRSYDGRFAQLAAHLPSLGVVECVRLFVQPSWRRIGVARALVAALIEKAHSHDVPVLYLHTQAFLDGAEAFWLREGFTVIDREADPLWQTVHMCRTLI